MGSIRMLYREPSLLLGKSTDDGGMLCNMKSSQSLWQASAPAAPTTSALSGSLSAEVAVIGAGYTGCSAALHLALAGVSAVVLEASDIGFGGAGRNVGLVNAGLWVMPDAIATALGEERGERLLEQLGGAP